MAAYYKAGGMGLIQALNNLFEKYGYFVEELVNVDLADGKPGRAEEIIKFFRKSALKEISGMRVVRLIDYLTGESLDLINKSKAATGLPASNSLKYLLENDSWFCIRPSGTEPKIKFYFGVKDSSQEKADQKMAALKDAIMRLTI